MLSFSKNDTGNFVVTQRTMSFTRTDVMTVEYTADLTQKRVNAEPFRPTNPADKAWFNKHHRKHFVELARQQANPKTVERILPGLGAAVSKAHRAWQELNPDVTREERKAAFEVTHARIRPGFVKMEVVIPQEIHGNR